MIANAIRVGIYLHLMLLNKIVSNKLFIFQKHILTIKLHINAVCFDAAAAVHAIARALFNRDEQLIAVVLAWHDVVVDFVGDRRMRAGSNDEPAGPPRQIGLNN